MSLNILKGKSKKEIRLELFKKVFTLDFWGLMFHNFMMLDIKTIYAVFIGIVIGLGTLLSYIFTGIAHIEFYAGIYLGLMIIIFIIDIIMKNIMKE